MRQASCRSRSFEIDAIHRERVTARVTKPLTVSLLVSLLRAGQSAVVRGTLEPRPHVRRLEQGPFTRRENRSQPTPWVHLRCSGAPRMWRGENSGSDCTSS